MRSLVEYDRLSELDTLEPASLPQERITNAMESIRISLEGMVQGLDTSKPLKPAPESLSNTEMGSLAVATLNAGPPASTRQLERWFARYDSHCKLLQNNTSFWEIWRH